MKSKFLFILLLGLSCTAFSQIDSTGVSKAAQFLNIPESLIWSSLTVLLWIVGHFGVKSKFASITLWLEKLVYLIYQGLVFINKSNLDKTNIKK